MSSSTTTTTTTLILSFWFMFIAYLIRFLFRFFLFFCFFDMNLLPFQIATRFFICHCQTRLIIIIIIITIIFIIVDFRDLGIKKKKKKKLMFECCLFVCLFISSIHYLGYNISLCLEYILERFFFLLASSLGIFLCVWCIFL